MNQIQNLNNQNDKNSASFMIRDHVKKNMNEIST
jgi:hypothetical protein